jgi:hypothetical protein
MKFKKLKYIQVLSNGSLILNNQTFSGLRTFSFSEKDNITFSLNFRKSVNNKKLPGYFSNYKKKYLCY